jgi:hypothetical protein
MQRGPWVMLFVSDPTDVGDLQEGVREVAHHAGPQGPLFPPFGAVLGATRGQALTYLDQFPTIYALGPGLGRSVSLA